MSLSTTQFSTLLYNTQGYSTLYTPIFCNTIQFSTTLHNTLQLNPILYNTLQHKPILYNTLQLNTILYNTLQFNPIIYNTLKHSKTLYNSIQFSTTLYNTFRLIIQHRRPTYLSLWPYYQSVIHSEFKTWCRDKSIFKNSISLRQ